VLAAVGLQGGQVLPAQGCTCFVLKGSDGGRVYGRTTYNNPGLRSLNFDRLPLDGGAIKVMPLDQPAQVTVLQP